MKVYIVLIADDLDGSETIEYIFATRELAEKYIEKNKNINEADKYLMRIIEEKIITNLSTVL